MPVRGRILCAGLYFFFLFQIPHAKPRSTSALTAAGCQVDADVDQGVSDDAQPHPAFHSRRSFVETSVQPVAAFEHTDASLPSGAPFLGFLKPAGFLSLAALPVILSRPS